MPAGSPGVMAMRAVMGSRRARRQFTPPERPASIGSKLTSTKASSRISRSQAWSSSSKAVAKNAQRLALTHLVAHVLIAALEHLENVETETAPERIQVSPTSVIIRSSKAGTIWPA